MKYTNLQIAGLGVLVLGALVLIAVILRRDTPTNDFVDTAPSKESSTFDNAKGQKKKLPVISTPSVEEQKAKPSAYTLKIDPAATFQSILQQHREAIGAVGLNPSKESRFENEEQLHLREGRLLALVFPGEVEKEAESLLKSASSDRRSRYFGTYILGVLALEGNEAALRVLVSVVGVASFDWKDLAFQGIGDADSIGKFRDVYLAGCREGLLTAYQIASRWLDEATITEMKAQLTGEHQFYAEEVLRRFEVLRDPRCDDQLDAIVRHQIPEEFYHPGRWAMKVLEARDVKRFQAALRAELDTTFHDSKAYWMTSRPGESFESAYTRSGHLGLGSLDWRSDHDDYLLALWRSGGHLKEVELARLRNFGYGCNPAERLAELLKNK